MGISIKGIVLGDIDVKNEEKEGIKVTGSYKIMSMSDVVIAKQDFNSYNDIKVTLSNETMQAVTKFRELLKKDVEAVLGFGETE